MVFEVVFGGTIGPDEGEVESRSTRFLGKIPSLADQVSDLKMADAPGSILPAVAFSGLPTAGLRLPPTWFPDMLL
jgi:hypothetical protein